MVLPRLEYHDLLKHQCPECGHSKVKAPSWFRGIRSYRCEGCLNIVQMTYDMKLKLYERHAR